MFILSPTALFPGVLVYQQLRRKFVLTLWFSNRSRSFRFLSSVLLRLLDLRRRQPVLFYRLLKLFRYVLDRLEDLNTVLLLAERRRQVEEITLVKIRKILLCIDFTNPFKGSGSVVCDLCNYRVQTLQQLNVSST